MSNAVRSSTRLENLFQPAWAQGKTESNKFAKIHRQRSVKPERRQNDKPAKRRAGRVVMARVAVLAAVGFLVGRTPWRSARGASEFGDAKAVLAARAALAGAIDRRDERAERPAPQRRCGIYGGFIPEERCGASPRVRSR